MPWKVSQENYLDVNQLLDLVQVSILNRPGQTTHLC